MRFLYDSRNRPLVELNVNGQVKKFLIDTGFTGNLAVGEKIASELDIHPKSRRYPAETAGGSAGFRIGYANLLWFGASRYIGVHVWETVSIGPVDGIVGVNLLVGYIPNVDFNEGLVSITDPAREDV